MNISMNFRKVRFDNDYEFQRYKLLRNRRLESLKIPRLFSIISPCEASVKTSG